MATSRRHLQTVIILLLLSLPAFSATHYISYSGGAEANSGASTAAPWKYACGMTGSTHACVAGDTYVLKGGDVWPNTSLPWYVDQAVTITYDPTWNTGQVLSIRPTSSGYNCTSLTVNISGGGGSSAAATANFRTTDFQAGLLAHVTVTNAGSGYTSNPTVSFTGSCTTFPTAVADIYSPIIDASGTVWNEANGPFANFGPILFNANVNVNHLEFRGAKFDHAIAQGSTILAMVNYRGTGTMSDLYVHNFGPDSISTVAPASFNGTGGLDVNIGYANSATVDGLFLDNQENEITGPCGFDDVGSPKSSPYCGSSYGVRGAGTLTNSYIHNVRGAVYGNAALSSQDYHGNTIWNVDWDCCQQHEDAVYFHGGGVLYDNILHDLAAGAAAFYVEASEGSGVCNTTSIFNNVIWNVGSSTPPIGYTAEFYNLACSGGTVNLAAYNNTLYSLGGTTQCIAAGQYAGQSAATLTIKNNHCISDQSTSHWYGNNGTTWGTWNGGASQATIDAANVIQVPATATSQGYVASNSYAPTGLTNATVTFSGADLTSIATGSLVPLTTSFDGNARPNGSAWQGGAYMFVNSSATALLTSSLATVLHGQTYTLTWTCGNSTSASIDQGIGAVSPTAGGTTSPITMNGTTTYTLTCFSAGGNAPAPVTVTQGGVTFRHDMKVTTGIKAQ